MLAEALGATCSLGQNPLVTDVEQNSGRIVPGALFAAMRGSRVDGAGFAPFAVERGAVAVLCEAGRAGELAHLGVPILDVADLRKALAKAAAFVHGEPTAALKVVGITGTNGKTTVAHLVEAGLEACGAVTGIVGTLGHRLRGRALGDGHTSPEADELQRIASRMREGGASHLVMEVSSIALAVDRVAEVAFDVAAKPRAIFGSACMFGVERYDASVRSPWMRCVAERTAAWSAPSRTSSLNAAVAFFERSKSPTSTRPPAARETRISMSVNARDVERFMGASVLQPWSS